MGNEQSSPIDPDTPPQTLRARSLSAVADYIKSGRARHVVVMTGAGISTTSGIPDFRSPKTGLYSNLARLDLPYPEAVFDIEFFQQNPKPFYVLAKELYPGKFAPSISHVFIALLAKKNLLKMLFTQNIDCLERRAGVPGDQIVEAHGSFATQRCVDCKTEFPDEDMLDHVHRSEPARCERCNGFVKPDIVFFGEQLPQEFSRNRGVPAEADLVLVLGTSLTVQPFALLPSLCPENTPRVLFNKEAVGDFGHRADDVIYLDTCDGGVRKLADELGWRDELESLWRQTLLGLGFDDGEIQRQLSTTEKRDAAMEDEMARLVDGVEHKLEISEQGHDAGADDGQGQPPAAPDQPATQGTLDAEDHRSDDQAATQSTEQATKRSPEGAGARASSDGATVHQRESGPTHADSALQGEADRPQNPGGDPTSTEDPKNPEAPTT